MVFFSAETSPQTGPAASAAQNLRIARVAELQLLSPVRLGPSGSAAHGPAQSIGRAGRASAVFTTPAMRTAGHAWRAFASAF
jgi:hypothetical protein